MSKESLKKAKKTKNDEFYTRYDDIQREINAYLEYDPDVFRNKIILLPCDDPEWSNFTRFFAQNFENFGLKKLVSTSYFDDSKSNGVSTAKTMSDANNYGKAELNDVRNDRGKIYTLSHDTNKSGTVDIEDLMWQYLDGDGDFRSDEVKILRDEADVIVTNPPFSLFREFIQWITEADKKFITICNKNCITYKEIFPLIKENKIWVGRTPMNIDLLFGVPDEANLKNTKSLGSGYKVVDGEVFARSQSIWLTNIEHGRRHQPLKLMTMDDNIRYSKHKEIRGHGYQKYDNYNAIEVPYTDAIPSDYDGVMGVPISFLDKYCPEQFEIVKFRKGDDDKDLSVNGTCPYFRILIKKRS